MKRFAIALSCSHCHRAGHDKRMIQRQHCCHTSRSARYRREISREVPTMHAAHARRARERARAARIFLNFELWLSHTHGAFDRFWGLLNREYLPALEAVRRNCPRRVQVAKGSAQHTGVYYASRWGVAVISLNWLSHTNPIAHTRLPRALPLAPRAHAHLASQPRPIGGVAG